MTTPHLPFGCRLVVAIPACNEAERITDCLAALAVQHDDRGAPLAEGRFAVLVFANNCHDDTAACARDFGSSCPFPVLVVEGTLPPEHSNAGRARKQAMDRAADLLEQAGVPDGLVFTTDADSRVCPTWIARSLAAIEAGADAVAGYIEAEPTELVRLGPAFLCRGRLEDTYLAAMAETLALCDPLPHDPWPNHRVASGASFAVTLRAYRAIGGLPPMALGEDVALAEALTGAGLRLRHAMDVTVTTSCRLDGRATGGAADTMRLRREEPDAPCDADMEPLAFVIRRAAWKGRLGRWYAARSAAGPRFAGRLGLDWRAMEQCADATPVFEPFWRRVEADSPVLRRQPPLRPSQLPAEIARAERALRLLRLRRGCVQAHPALAPREPPR